MPSPHVERVIDHLWRSLEGFPPPQVYALLDAARSELIFRKLGESDIEVECLYRGEKARELADVAPYLVHLQRENPFTRWVLENGWGKSWGIFLGSSASLNELRRHFRTFLMVYDEEGTPLYFRYYDPRVLRVYLPTCNAEELKTVFGPVEQYLLEDEDPSTALRFRDSSGVLIQEKLPLKIDL
jgi:hypothetical protein